MLNSFPSSTTASSLFGSQPQASSTGLFGAPKPTSSLFGTTTNTTQPTGGIFGQQQPASSGFGSTGILGANKPQSAFGQVSQPSIFGQQPPQQQGGLFGNTSTSATGFGATTTSTSMFGSNPVSSFGFGGQQQPPQQQQTTGGLFGQKPAQPFSSFGSTQQPQQFGNTATTGSSLFGQPSQSSTTGGGLFGSTSTTNKPSSLFGSTSNNQSAGSFGTVKFTPPTGSDTMQLKGQQTQVSTKQMCISAMKDFETRSLEEIRGVDYASGRKVSTSSAPGSVFGQQQPQQQGGLFGSTISKPGGLFGAPSTTTTTNSLFGSQQPPSSTGLFGATKPAGSMFGANITTTQPNVGLFGQPQPASSGFGSTGILGANKPSAFGQVSQPSIFGQPQLQQGGLFGPPSIGATTTSTSMFGSNPVPSFGFGGQQQPPQQQQTTGGLFGQKPAQPFSSFGAAQQPQPFGNPATTGSSLFGQPSQQPTIGGGLFGSNTITANKPSLFGSTLNNNQSAGSFGTANLQSTIGFSSNINTASLQKAIIDSQLSTLPYGDSPLLKISSSPRKTAQDINILQRQLNFSSKDDGQNSTSPQQNSFLADISVVSTISKGTQELSKDVSIGETNIFDTSLSYKPIIILPSVGFGAALGLRHSPKLTKSFASEKSFISGKSSLHHSFIEDDNNKKIKSLDMSVVFEPCNNDNNYFLVEKSQVNSVAVPLHLSPSSEESERPIIEEIPSPPEEIIPEILSSKENVQHHHQQQKNLKNKFKIILTRPEYYTEPSIENLESLFNSCGTCIIEGGLTIGRLGYGSVFWRGPLELNSQDLNFDEVVHFRNKEVVVYPDESKKPQIGVGLNKEAEVSLDNVWPIDSKTKMPIKDADELRKMNFKAKLERLCLRMDTNFCDYQPSTGTWQFQVEHFSKYGFQEEDDEDIIDIQHQQKQQPQSHFDNNNLNQIDVQKRRAAHVQALVQKAKVPLREIQKSLEEKHKQNNNNNNKREYNKKQQNFDNTCIDEDQFDGTIEFNDDDSKLFQEEIIRKKLRFDDTLFDSSKLLNLVTNKEQQQQISSYQKPKLIERLPKYHYQGLSSENLKNSILKKCEINFELPSCRIGFNQDLIFAAVPSSTHLNVVNIYQTKVIVPTVKNYFIQYIRCNGLNQQQSLINLELSSLVKFDPPSPILCFLDEFLTNSFLEDDRKNIDKSFDEICKILLMNINNIEDKISQRILMGDWLTNQLEENIIINNNQQNQTKPFFTIFNFLINGQVKKAAQYARELNLLNLAMLLCVYQTTSVSLVRNLVAKQLSIARKQPNSDVNYLKILQLLSGEFVKGNNNNGRGGGCLQGLNWLQVLGILIWYHSSPTTTLIECLDILQELM